MACMKRMMKAESQEEYTAALDDLTASALWSANDSRVGTYVTCSWLPFVALWVSYLHRRDGVFQGTTNNFVEAANSVLKKCLSADDTNSGSIFAVIHSIVSYMNLAHANYLNDINALHPNRQAQRRTVTPEMAHVTGGRTELQAGYITREMMAGVNDVVVAGATLQSEDCVVFRTAEVTAAAAALGSQQHGRDGGAENPAPPETVTLTATHTATSGCGPTTCVVCECTCRVFLYDYQQLSPCKHIFAVLSVYEEVACQDLHCWRTCLNSALTTEPSSYVPTDWVQLRKRLLRDATSGSCDFAPFADDAYDGSAWLECAAVCDDAARAADTHSAAELTAATADFVPCDAGAGPAAGTAAGTAAAPAADDGVCPLRAWFQSHMAQDRDTVAAELQKFHALPRRNLVHFARKLRLSLAKKLTGSAQEASFMQGTSRQTLVATVCVDSAMLRFYSGSHRRTAAAMRAADAACRRDRRDRRYAACEGAADAAGGVCDSLAGVQPAKRGRPRSRRRARVAGGGGQSGAARRQRRRLAATHTLGIAASDVQRSAREQDRAAGARVILPLDLPRRAAALASTVTNLSPNEVDRLRGVQQHVDGAANQEWLRMRMCRMTATKVARQPGGAFGSASFAQGLILGEFGGNEATRHGNANEDSAAQALDTLLTHEVALVRLFSDAAGAPMPHRCAEFRFRLEEQGMRVLHRDARAMGWAGARCLLSNALESTKVTLTHDCASGQPRPHSAPVTQQSRAGIHEPHGTHGCHVCRGGGDQVPSVQKQAPDRHCALANIILA